MTIQDYLEITFNIKGKIIGRLNSNLKYSCYFELFDRIIENFNQVFGVSISCELVIIENSDCNCQLINFNNKKYIIISYDNIHTFDIMLNLLTFDVNDNSILTDTAKFETIWKFSYQSKNEQSSFLNKSLEELDYFSIYKSAEYSADFIECDNDLLLYIKKLHNYHYGFELFITFIISHEICHYVFKEDDMDFSVFIDTMMQIQCNDERNDWVERCLISSREILSRASAKKEMTADIGALLIIKKMYLDSNRIDERLIPIYMIILFNNLYYFHIVNTEFKHKNILELMVRKALCIHFLKVKSPSLYLQNINYYKLLCHIDSYLIEMVMDLIDNDICISSSKSLCKPFDTKNLNMFICRLITRMKFINKNYIPDGYDINHTNNTRLVYNWIKDTARELTYDK